jgi:hypothetical protein
MKCITRAAWMVVAVAAAVVPGCGQKGTANTAASAAEGAGKYLPPGANAYIAIDVKAALAAPAIASLKQQLLAAAPPPCTPVVDALDRVTIGAYGAGERVLMIFPHKVKEGEPRPDDQVVMVVQGPTRDALLACLDALAGRDGETPPPSATETRDGKEIRVLGSAGEKRLFSVGDTTHVVTSVATLDAALAAAAGGPSFAGSPALELLPQVPAGAVVVGMVLPAGVLGDLLDEMLGPFAGGKPVPSPRSLAVSIALGSDLAVRGALQLADEAAAQTLAQAAQGMLAKSREMNGSAGSGANALEALVKDASVDRSGSVVRVDARFTVDALLQAFFAPRRRPAGTERP